MLPLKPEHANKDQAISGTSFSVRRVLVRYSYPRNGNVHNPTPSYRWWLILDDKLVDNDASMRKLVAIARRPGAEADYRAV